MGTVVGLRDDGTLLDGKDVGGLLLGIAVGLKDGMAEGNSVGNALVS